MTAIRFVLDYVIPAILLASVVLYRPEYPYNWVLGGLAIGWSIYSWFISRASRHTPRELDQH